MPITRIYGCDSCGHTWRHLHLSRDEPVPPCPNPDCDSRAVPVEQLAAPGINRGEAKPGFTVPQSQAKREQLAADLALKPTGMTDINTGMKAGDIAAKPVAMPSVKDLPADFQAQARQLATPRFIDGGGFGQAAADPTRARNIGLIGSGNKMPALNQLPRRTIIDRRK